MKPDPLLRAAGVLNSHGPEVAEHVASFEQRQVDAIRDLVKRQQIDCDYEDTKVMDICKYPQGRDKMKANIEKITKAGISTAKTIKFYAGKEAEEVSALSDTTTSVSINGVLLADSPNRFLESEVPCHATHTTPLVWLHTDL